MKRNKFIIFLIFSVLLVTGCEKENSSGDDSNTDSLPSSSLPISGDDSSSVSESSEAPSSDPSSSSELPSIPSSEDPAPENPYYASINGMATGTTLLNSVRSLITSTHKTETTYGGLASVFKKSDADPKKSGNIIWFYSGTSVPFSGFGGSNGQTNREHVWPKNGGKAFPAESKAGSDAHHLRPTETQLNSERSSLSFGIVAQTSGNIAKQNGSTNYATGDYLSYKSSSFFYPGKGFRGQTARILFYVQARWGSAYDLKFVLGSGSNKTIGDMETLMKWHLQEPVSELEEIRNEEIFKIQGNRNPFIDMPQYACSIYANDGQSYNTKVKSVCNAN